MDNIPEWLRNRAFELTCPDHKTRLQPELKEVRTGYHNILRKVMPIAFCSEENCHYWVEVHPNYTLKP